MVKMYRDFESRQDFDDYDDDVVFDDGGVVTWERYNTETREVEDYIDIEAGDDDRVEAMERLVDVNNPNGSWHGYTYVYSSGGVIKHIRQKETGY
jgi:hypothetical protein